MTANHPDFQALPDLAVRTLGGSVVYANDESFAARENLLAPEPPEFDESTFGHKGKVYDGWETRRRRELGHDTAIVRLGAAGIVRGVVVDTSWFAGNYPPEVSVEATCVAGHPAVTELLEHARWETIVERAAVKGDSRNPFPVSSGHRWTHVRLTIHPDGGVARLRVHGEVVPDPRFLDAAGTVDLAATEHGGLIVGCSNAFYSSPDKLLAPGPTRSMGEGWETARRRDSGHEWVTVRLAGPGILVLAELDTSYFLHNAPGWAVLRGCDSPGTSPAADTPWFEVLARTPLQPDTRHRFVLSGTRQVTHVRMDIFPDGGMARLRLLGRLSTEGREHTGLRWFNALPAAAAAQALTEAGVDADGTHALLARRPLAQPGDLPSGARRLLAGP